MLTLICQNCFGYNDVSEFTKGKDQIVLCVSCRLELLTPRNSEAQVSDLQKQITKSIPITLSENVWSWFNEESGKWNGGESEFILYLISLAQRPKGRWSNNVSLGYTILGAQKLGYSQEQIEQLVRSIYNEFDITSLDEALVVYEHSPY